MIVDARAAIVLAVDAAASAESFATVDIRFVAPLQILGDGPPSGRGYLVGLDAGGVFQIVVLDPDGHIVGISPGLPDIDFASLGL